MAEDNTMIGKKQIAYIMSDEEFQEYHAKKRKEKLLNDMIAATKSPFSVKNVKPTKRVVSVGKGELMPIEEPISKESSKPSLLNDSDWSAILEKASEFTPSPITEITKNEMGEFRLDDIGVREEEASYYKMFKKEQAMLAEILKDVSEQSKSVSNKLKDMISKSSGYGGVSKTYPDLVNAVNSLNSTRLNIIKEMATIKKNIADMDYRKSKDSGSSEVGATNEEIADNFYKQIVNNRKGFIDSAMANVGIGTYNGNFSNTPNPMDVQFNDAGNNIRNNVQLDDEQPARRSFSITSPIGSYGNNDNDDIDDETAIDPYGYIRNENRNVSVCVQRFSDGRLEFVAIDGEGESVDDYELPSDELLLSLQIRPLSRYANDSEGRRYRIIDIDSDGVDISDVLSDDSDSSYQDNRL